MITGHFPAFQSFSFYDNSTMLSSTDLERLIAAKRREIEKEKTILGLSPPRGTNPENDKENIKSASKKVSVSEGTVSTRNGAKAQREDDTALREVDENIPADLERYIRRYLGLPVMLKAGEYSPNNPLIRGERTSGDALLGLGEYERRRNTLRKLRQQQYREYLDQQAKKKQEAKEQAEKERREREEREREKEERERERLSLEREREPSPERRRASVPHTHNIGANNSYVTKVDTAVQVDGVHRPLSVAVQTDEAELFRLPPSPSKYQLTEAERELSPRSVADGRRELPAHCSYTRAADNARRHSYTHYDERSPSLLKKTNKDKLVSDLRHSYMPSIFDADAIQMRNLQAEKEAAARRQFYQQELKNQIVEQQRIREERKTREKMLEQAEMRRLEEQLRMLRVAQEREVDKQHEITAAIKDNTTEYDTARITLQKEIDAEQQTLLRAATQPGRIKRTHTSRSQTTPSKLPLYYPRTQDKDKKPYSVNIPDNSIFSPNYDVDSYLRRNLNFKDGKKERKESQSERNERNYLQDDYIDSIECIGERYDKDKYQEYDKTKDRYQEITMDAKKYENDRKIEKILDKYDNERIEKVLVHEKERKVDKNLERPIEPSVTKDVLPVLRHSPKITAKLIENEGISDKMKVVEDKWKVPAVQKNILKSLPNEEGKNVSILTQLGSIRRQLQLEQLKLDMMLKDDEV